ncbi:MAG: hypothetical protein HYY04_15600 [Chloroflexi bacterium]|nr:hypothetical protein [Chloroflexota bacterium]
MQGGRERVRRLLRGETPDRVPLYDLIRNDVVLSHFAGEAVTPENGAVLVPRVFPRIVDATRPRIRTPEVEREETLPDGRKVTYRRWTTWTEKHPFTDAETHAAKLRQRIASAAPEMWTAEDDQRQAEYLAAHRAWEQRFGDEVFLFWGSPASVGLYGMIDEIGLESFVYLFHDCPDIVPEYLDWTTARGLARIGHLPDDARIEGVMLGEDVAFKTGTFLSPRWMDREFIPRLARIVEALHERGIKVIFHSDGNLNAILPGLVDAGIDVLNPIEILAGMDPAAIHRRFPDLILAGAIDVSQLLPYGTPAEIRRVVTRTIAETDGRIMVGSSTELHKEVPLENYLAMREAVLGYPLS